MSAIAAILLEAAGSLAVPVIKKILGDKIGGAGGELAGNVIDIIAGQAGVPVEKLPDVKPAELDKAIVAAEPMAVELLTLHVESQRLMNENLQAELDKGGPVWTWGWRPGWMWLLAVFWLYALILRPVVNAAFGASIEALDMGVLMTLTGLYMTAYLGGHTVKDVVAKWAGK